MLELSYESPRDSRHYRRREGEALLTSAVWWDTGVMLACVGIMLLTLTGAPMSLLMLPVAFLIGLIQILVVGSKTFLGLWYAPSRLGRFTRVIVAWLLSVGMCIGAVCASMHNLRTCP